jgi:hypothetical protein
VVTFPARNISLAPRITLVAPCERRGLRVTIRTEQPKILW